MNKRVRKILGNLFITSTAFLWTSCGNDSASAADITIPQAGNNPASSSSEPIPTSSSESITSSNGASRAFINIEEELSKLEKPDTTGLRGTTVTGYKACIAGILADGNSEYLSYIGRDGEFEAECVVNNRIEAFLESPQGASLSQSLKNCYKSATYLISAGALDYGVVPCSSYSDDVIVDDQYINNLLKADEIKRKDFKEALERVNKHLAGCESPE
ncbi:MAG: hypothetical protein II892_02190 [Fibrobacter sp.]|nr:hypothetical protein [Fibrobacter sp.]MBQ3779977.1 hypothetical protein [Fibrobacter sp.]